MEQTVSNIRERHFAKLPSSELAKSVLIRNIYSDKNINDFVFSVIADYGLDKVCTIDDVAQWQAFDELDMKKLQKQKYKPFLLPLPTGEYHKLEGESFNNVVLFLKTSYKTTVIEAYVQIIRIEDIV